MFSGIVRHVHASTAIAFAALVLSMAGGAFALGGQGGSGPKAASAGGSSGGRSAGVATATASKKKSKGKAGPRGPRGPAGATGAAGPTGPAGTGGAQGPQGPAGGTGLQGPEGKEGKQGEPGKTEIKTETNFAPTLPSKATETGSWSFTAYEKPVPGLTHINVPISFSIPLAAGTPGSPVIESEHVYFIAAGATATSGEGCDIGTAEKPEAAPGNLCVYTTALQPTVQSSEPPLSFDSGLSQEGVGTTGANLIFFIDKYEGGTGEGTAEGVGTWAVTAK